MDVDGIVFDLRAEGVYRFYRLPKLSEQRLVWHGNLSSLLSMLGYLWVYGMEDEPIQPDQALAVICQRMVVAACGSLAYLAVELLTRAGIPARRVALASLEPWGGQDDGHTLVEVRSEAGGAADWMLYDPSFNVRFVDRHHHLSLAEAVVAFKHGQVKLHRLPGNAGHASYRIRGTDYGFWVDERRKSDAILYDWYRRMAGVPLIHANGHYAFDADGLSESDRARLARRHQMMEHDAFLNRFYRTRITGPVNSSQDHDQDAKRCIGNVPHVNETRSYQC